MGTGLELAEAFAETAGGQGEAHSNALLSGLASLGMGGAPGANSSCNSILGRLKRCGPAPISNGAGFPDLFLISQDLKLHKLFIFYFLRKSMVTLLLSFLMFIVVQ